MKDLFQVLTTKGYKPQSQEDHITFPVCPVCKDNTGANVLTEDSYICPVCEDQTAKAFLSRLGIEWDFSSEDFSELLEANIDEVFNPERVNGVTTGFKTIDEKTGGLRKGHFYLLAAETGMGKSVFAVNLIINLINKTSHNASYFDLENGRDANFTRFLMVQGYKTPEFFQDQANKVTAVEIGNKFKGRLIYRDHVKLSGSLTSSAGQGMAREIGEIIKSDVINKKVRLVVIDPLENFELSSDDYNAISKVVILLKNLAQELGISIIVLHHIRKADRKSQMVSNLAEAPVTSYRIPTIHDILGTSKITNMATDVWALVRQKDSPSQEEAGRTLLRILKQRESSLLGDIHLVMNLSNLRFAELAPVEDDEGYKAAKQIFSYKEAE